jgi:5,10-methylenetetrahydromethanopterin reductase
VVAVSVAFQTDKTAADYARLALQAEALGFDGVSVFHDFGFQPSLFALLEMARVTTQVRLGAACLNPFLLHPVEIAGQAAALQLASGGRAYVGVARGAWLERVGVIADRPLRRLAEAVEVIRRLLRGDESPYNGEIFPLAAGTRLHYALPDPPQLLIGTWGARGLGLAGQVADEVKLGGCANPDMVRLARTRLDAACTAAGRDPASVGLVAGAVTVVDDDAVAARALARSEVAMYLDVVAALDETVTVPAEVLDPLRAALATGTEAGQYVPDDLLHRFAFAGSPDDIAAHAIELVEAGASRIEFGTPHGLSSDRGVELLGRKVLPQLKDGS